MNNTHVYDVIIIGAGVSGLACASKILDSAQEIDLLIISPQMGGKLIVSDNGFFNYGPYFIRDDYYNLFKYFKKTSEIGWKDFRFNIGEEFYVIDICFVRYVFSHLKFKNILKKFYKEYKIFREKCYKMSQKDAIESMPFLYNLYKKNGQEFIQEMSLNRYFDRYLSFILCAVSFSLPDRMNAFHLLSLLLTMIIKSYRYEFDGKELFEKISHYYVKDRVIWINKANSYFEIKTQNNKNYVSKQVVVATSTDVSKKLLNLKTNYSNDIYVFHLSGDIKEKYIGRRTNLFRNFYDILIVESNTQSKKEFLLYSKSSSPPIYKIFDSYKIIKEFAWKECFHLNGDSLLEFEQEKNLFVIGDHNIPFMEDAFIYGCFAAKVVLERLV